MTLPKAIILDLDDTILDSGDPDVAWRTVCQEVALPDGRFGGSATGKHPADGVEGVTAEGLFAAVIEARDWFWDDNQRAREGRLDLVDARRTIFRSAFSALGVQDVAAGALDAMAKRYTALRDDAVVPFPGALQALERLRSTGVMLALLTNGSAEKQREKIARFDLEVFFDHVQVEGELGVGKPDPRSFESVLEALSVAPGRRLDGGRQPPVRHSGGATGRLVRYLDRCPRNRAGDRGGSRAGPRHLLVERTPSVAPQSRSRRFASLCAGFASGPATPSIMEQPPKGARLPSADVP